MLETIQGYRWNRLIKGANQKLNAEDNGLCQILKKKGAMSCIQSRMLIEQHFFPIVCWLVTMINIIFKGHKWAETDPYTRHYGSQEYMKVRITKEMQAKKRNLSLLCINKIQISVCLVATSKSKKVLQYLSHQILRYVHGALNVDKKN